jgi:hypothetical protein
LVFSNRKYRHRTFISTGQSKGRKQETVRTRYCVAQRLNSAWWASGKSPVSHGRKWAEAGGAS